MSIPSILLSRDYPFPNLSKSTQISKMSDIFAPAPEPPTELGRYRVLSSTAGVRVSPLQLGAMSIGNAWKEFMGSMDKKTSFALLDAFVEAGGNFIDTANNYQDEQSETWLGEWVRSPASKNTHYAGAVAFYLFVRR